MTPLPDRLPDQLAEFGPAALAAVVVAVYLVVGEPFVGHVLHRRFEARLFRDPAARRSFYSRLLVLEWGLSVLVALIWLAAPGVGAAAVGLRWPQRWPGPVTGVAVLVVLGLVVVSILALRSGALAEAGHRPPPAGEGRQAEPAAHATVALLPRTPPERRLFVLVGLTAGICEEWLYRGFFLAVLAALAPQLPAAALIAAAALAFGSAHAYQGRAGVFTTGVLGGVLAALYVESGSLLFPVLLHAAIDLRFLLVPASALPAGGAGGGLPERSDRR